MRRSLMALSIRVCPGNVCTSTQGSLRELIRLSVNNQRAWFPTSLVATSSASPRPMEVDRRVDHLLRPTFHGRFPCFKEASNHLSFTMLQDLSGPSTTDFTVNCVLLRTVLTIVPRAIIMTSRRHIRVRPIYRCNDSGLFYHRTK